MNLCDETGTVRNWIQLNLNAAVLPWRLFFPALRSILRTAIRDLGGPIRKRCFYRSSAGAAGLEKLPFPCSSSPRPAGPAALAASRAPGAAPAARPYPLTGTRPLPAEGGACCRPAPGARLAIGCGAGPRPPAVTALACLRLLRLRGDSDALGGRGPPRCSDGGACAGGRGAAQRAVGAMKVRVSSAAVRAWGVRRGGSAGEPGRLGPGLGGGWGRGSRSALHAPAPGRGRRAGPATGGRCLRPGEGRWGEGSGARRGGNCPLVLASSEREPDAAARGFLRGAEAALAVRPAPGSRERAAAGSGSGRAGSSRGSCPCRPKPLPP